MTLFFYGTLRHRPLLEVVLGRPARLVPATLAGYGVRGVTGGTWPTLVTAPGGAAEGVLLADTSAADVARLDFYEGAYDYDLRSVEVSTAAGPVAARVYFPTAMQAPPAGPWSLADWREAHGALTTQAAVEVMALQGLLTPAEIRDRYAQMLVRAASALRARAEPAPARVRSPRGAEAVRVVATRRPYTSFFAMVEQDLSFATFAGGQSAVVTRAAFLAGDAATVLPYDPVRDRVLLVEQFRYGLFARGDPRPWSLEPIAGRIDPGETPADTARREAWEEARVRVGEVIEVGRYYAVPGASSEWVVSHVALADLPDGTETVAGEESEAEDIRSHLVSYRDAMDMIATGEAATAPLIVSLQWLALHRDRLRGGVPDGPPPR